MGVGLHPRAGDAVITHQGIFRLVGAGVIYGTDGEQGLAGLAELRTQNNRCREGYPRTVVAAQIEAAGEHGSEVVFAPRSDVISKEPHQILQFIASLVLRLCGGDIYTSSTNFSFRNNVIDYKRISIYNNTGGTGTSNFLINNISITAVPEPSAALLGCLGLMGLLRRRA